MGKAVGIDLGTANSVIAVMEGGTAQVIPNQEGARTTPSIVAFTNEGERLVGQTAERQALTNSKNTIHAAKRLIGRRFDSPEIQGAREVLPYEIVPSANGDAHIQIDDRVYSPPEISAIVLQKLKAAAEDHLGEPVEEAIITSPAFFNDSQRQATKDAGTIAGLKVLRILSEATAAALAYGAQQTQASRVAVYDLGGGSFDVSILELQDGFYQVLSTGGDTYLGGEDIDQLIINWLVKEFKQECEIDLTGDGLALQRLKEAAEKAKCELSTSDQSEIVLPLISTNESGPKHLNTVLTRGRLEEMIAPLLERTIEPCMAAVKDAGLRKDEIDDVVLVGGQTRTPKVVETVRRIFGREPNRSVNPEEVVAIGAAIQTGIISGEVTDLVLLDVTPHTLGIETVGGTFTPLIDRQATIPTKKSRIFTTLTDKQTRVEVHVLQGENEQAAYNRSLGRFRLADIAPAQAGVPQIEVSFEIDINGIVQVSALDQATGQQQSIVTRARSGLSDAEVERARKEMLGSAWNRDELTGLANRRSLETDLARDIKTARFEEGSLAVVLMDLDRFEALNAEHGDKAGNSVLRAFAQLVVEQVKDVGRVYRFAGDELMLCLPKHTSREAASVTEELRREIQNAELTDARLKVSISAGVACFPKDGADIQDLVEGADYALLQAKRAGRNRVSVFGDDSDAAGVRESAPGSPPELPPQSREPAEE